jgi:predicted HTH domain antitoxin
VNKQPDAETRERLEYLRSQIEAERISMSEIAELADLADYIASDDVVLREWAGIPEGDR